MCPMHNVQQRELICLRSQEDQTLIDDLPHKGVLYKHIPLTNHQNYTYKQNSIHSQLQAPGSKKTTIMQCSTEHNKQIKKQSAKGSKKPKEKVKNMKTSKVLKIIFSLVLSIIVIKLVVLDPISDMNEKLYNIESKMKGYQIRKQIYNIKLRDDNFRIKQNNVKIQPIEESIQNISKQNIKQQKNYKIQQSKILYQKQQNQQNNKNTPQIKISSQKFQQKIYGKQVQHKGFQKEQIKKQNMNKSKLKVQIEENNQIISKKKDKPLNEQKQMGMNPNQNGKLQVIPSSSQQSSQVHQNSLFKIINQNNSSFKNQSLSSKHISISNDLIEQKQPQISSIKSQNTIQNHDHKIPTSFYQIQKCLNYIKDQFQKYGQLYTFQQDINQVIQLSNVNNFTKRIFSHINKVQFQEAVNLLDVIHKINQKGQIIVQDNPCQYAQKTIQRIKKLNQRQFNRLNLIYQIDHYSKQQLRFCIVTNSYKNAFNGLMYRNIDSILQQNYSNYHVVYTDDNSPDLTGHKVNLYLDQKGSQVKNKFKVKINAERKGMMENIYNAITQDCQPGQIVVMLDGDDSFIGIHVLSLLNAVYQKQKLALMWNNFLEIQWNKQAILGFSRVYADFQKDQKSYRQRGIFISSHLKSFYVDLFRKIRLQDLKHEDGRFYGGASDTVMMMPMLEMSYPRHKYVPQIVYQYRIDTGQIGMLMNREDQKRALDKVATSKMYEKLTDFLFIDRALESVQTSKK